MANTQLININRNSSKKYNQPQLTHNTTSTLTVVGIDMKMTFHQPTPNTQQKCEGGSEEHYLLELSCAPLLLSSSLILCHNCSQHCLDDIIITKHNMNSNCIENHNNNINSNFIIIPLLSKILWFTRHFPGKVVTSKTLYLEKVFPFLARATVGNSLYVSLCQSVS